MGLARMRKISLTLSSLCLIAATIVACGFKSDLYLPGEKPPVTESELQQILQAPATDQQRQQDDEEEETEGVIVPIPESGSL